MTGLNLRELKMLLVLGAAAVAGLVMGVVSMILITRIVDILAR